MFARVLVSLPRMGQCYSQGFGCGHLPVSSTHGCAAAALLIGKGLCYKENQEPTCSWLLTGESAIDVVCPTKLNG